MNLFARFYRIITVGLVATVMVACASHETNVESQDQHIAWQHHQQQLNELSVFQATGSLSYITEKTKYYGRFFVNQTAPNEYQLKLTTPFGTNMFTLTVTSYLAELVDKNNQKYQDVNVERLMSNLTGMEIPFKSFHNWFKGFSDNVTQDQIDKQGRLLQTTLMQGSQRWLLVINKYSPYRFANKDIDLPKSIELTNNNDTLKLTINNWKLN